MTLALLITAVGGAWAQDAYEEITTATKGTNTYTGDHFKITASQGCDKDGIKFWDMQNHGTATIEALNGEYITKIEMHMTYGGGFATTITTTAGTLVATNLAGNSNDISVIDINATSVEIGTNHSGASYIQISKFVIYYTTEPAGPTVTVNEAKTEASFDMPTYNTDFSYELVRDMSINMTIKIGDGNDGYRIRLQKNEQTGKYEPAEMTVQQMMALAKVHDAIEDYDLTFGVLGANCIVNIYAANENNEATGNAIAIQDLVPGRYIAKAVAATGSAYEGETGMSNIFEFYEGYQVVIPAGEYVTYYKDEAVRLDEKDKNDIELCTITAIEDGKAVLSDNFDAMKANTPFLLKNTTTEEKTILLIPCNEPDLAVTVAKEFKGTEGACEFSEELMAIADFYVCNGKEFIKVRGAGTLAPNKACLRIEGNNTPASIPFRRSIGGEGEGTTGVDLIDNGKLIIDNDGWYDLNGRRLQGKPSQKGIYIKNGRKVVIK